MMEYTRLGESGLRISRIGMGTFSFGDPRWQSWMLTEEQCEPILERAIERGINFIDTADGYSQGVSEEIIGRLWSKYARREDLVIATKVGMPMGPSVNERGLSRKHLMHAVDASLRRLKVDYIDLYQFHQMDHGTPIEESLEAFHDIVKSGKVRYVGTSNILAWQMMKILMICQERGWVRPVSVQNHYNLAYREEEREMMPLCRDQEIGFIPWSPLARGFLAGSMDRAKGLVSKRAASDKRIAEYFGENHDYDVLEQVRECASRHGVTAAQAALAWMLAKRQVSAPIIGATRVRHVDEAVDALELRLDDTDITAMEAPYRPHRVLLHV